MEFSGSFCTPLVFGHVVIISGKIKEDAESLEISLAADTHNFDIPLHIEVIFGKDARIVRNTKLNNQLGAIEDSAGFSKEKNPLKSGSIFILYILIGMDRFHISINNHHFCDYIYRSSVKRIIQCHLLKGLDKITHFDHRKTFPFPYPTHQTRFLQDVAFSNDVPIPFKEGNVIIIKGMTSGNKDGGFTIKFLVGKMEQQAFHFDVRFGDELVIRNHSVNESGELFEDAIEKYGEFPFTFGSLFKMAIGFDENGVRTSVNGQFFCEFPYKAPITQFSGLKIREKKDMRLDIWEVDHMKIDIKLSLLDTFSRLK